MLWGVTHLIANGGNETFPCIESTTEAVFSFGDGSGQVFLLDTSAARQSF